MQGARARRGPLCLCASVAFLSSSGPKIGVMGRVPVKLVILLVGVIVAVAIPIAVSVHRSNQAVAEWKAALSVEQVRGKTARELVERLGEPRAMERDPP